MLAVLGLAMPALAAPVVRYRDDSGKEARLEGTIVKEGPAGVTIKLSIGAARDIPVTQIRDVEYDLPGRFRLDLLQAVTEERGIDLAAKSVRVKQITDARTRYQNILAGLTASPAKRHMQFKVAQMTALLAEEQQAPAADAIQKLKAYKADNADSWEITPCCQLLGQLQAGENDYEAAQKTYEDLAAIHGVPKSIKQDCNLRVAELLVREKKYAVAKARVAELMQDSPAGDPQRPRLEIALAECQAASGELDPAVKSLTALIQQPIDNVTKAHAYNILGDCYYNREKWKDALWNYLYVDVIYHQNREEQARAIYYASKAFEKLGDTKRAAAYRDRLDKSFVGTEYQRRWDVERHQRPAG